MLNSVKMSTKKKSNIEINGPIINGSVTIAYAKCGQKNCRCHADRKAMHGPYYRWSGMVDGRKTTRTIDLALAQKIKSWIKNYQKLQKKIDQLIKDTLESEEWEKKETK